MLKINENSHNKKMKKDIITLLADEVVAIENAYRYPDCFWNIKVEGKERFIYLRNKDSAQRFSQKFNQLVKTKIGNSSITFKRIMIWSCTKNWGKF